jgi:hypothetical protein
MGDFSNFQRGQIVCALLVGASVVITAALLGVSRAAVPKVMVVSSSRNIGQKRKLSERFGRGLCLKIIEVLQQKL